MNVVDGEASGHVMISLSPGMQEAPAGHSVPAHLQHSANHWKNK